MKVDVKVKNLGRIKDATFKVRPMTVITGYNGTGKSFFTKSLYSIFNVINKNVYYEAINREIRQLQLYLSSYIDMIDISNENGEFLNSILSDVLRLKNDFDDTRKWKINDFLNFIISKQADIKKIKENYDIYRQKIINDAAKIKISSIKTISDIIDSIDLLFSKQKDYYNHLVIEHIENELKDNFQISSLTELIKFEAKEILINIENLISLTFSEDNIYLELGSDFVDEVTSLSNVVFFESPAYWKVREALKRAKNFPVIPQKYLNDYLISIPKYIYDTNQDDILTGVPKYFYDLDIALNTKTKTAGCFQEIANSLEETLGGEFIFKNDDVSFKDKQTGRDISKNLISFGMTNLGMIQALLKHNVITEGSFIFIDEPETNLHPEWQIILIRALLELSHKGVNIIITTHSTDIIKALEVTIKKQKIEIMEDFISVHFVESDGTLLKFESDDVQKQLIEARTILNSTYENLYFSDL